jgi:streptogramin lyase
MRIRALVLGIAVTAGGLVGLLALTIAPAEAASPPVAITDEATEVKRARATLAGYVLPQGEPTDYYFEYGTGACSPITETCGVKTPTRGPVTEEGSVEPFKLTRLNPGTTYHAWLVASNAGGTVHGEEITFATATAEPKEYVLEKTLEGYAYQGPWGVGLNQVTGDVYASDRSASPVPIKQYDSSGALLSSTTMPAGSGGETRQLAVANTGNAEQGDVYIADESDGVAYKFDPNANGELQPDPTTPKVPATGTVSEPKGVAVDAGGDVYLTSSSAGTVSKFSPTGAVITENLITGLTNPFALAVDATGDIYVATESGTIEYKPDGTCFELAVAPVTPGECEKITAGVDKGIALNAADDIFVSTEESGAVEYSSAAGHTPIPNPELEKQAKSARGLAVNNTTNAIYIADLESSTVKAFRFLNALPVIVTTEPATQVKGPVEELKGKVNPGGQEPAEYFFEYGTSPCLAETCGTVASEPSEVPLVGDEEIPVSVRLDNLAPNTTFYFRVVGVNEESGVEYGAEQTFRTGSESSPPEAPKGASVEETKTPASEPIYPLLTSIKPVPIPTVIKKPPTRAQLLAKALASCNRKPKKQRPACKRQARKKYGAATKSVAKKKRRK